MIVGAYDAMPYLADCISSAVNQSIDPGRVEIIAVDDGSRDGSGELLDEAAAVTPNLRVIHQENSGNAARPRNVGLAAIACCRRAKWRSISGQKSGSGQRV